jgi:hypothetical protein
VFPRKSLVALVMLLVLVSTALANGSTWRQGEEALWSRAYKAGVCDNTLVASNPARLSILANCSQVVGDSAVAARLHTFWVNVSNGASCSSSFGGYVPTNVDADVRYRCTYYAAN